MDFVVDYWPYVAALLPTVGVAFLFYWVIKYMIEADRNERKALAKWNAENSASTKRGNSSSAKREDNGSEGGAGNHQEK